MKYLVSAFVVVTGIFMGCGDSEPDYPNEPHIELVDLMFGVATNPLALDSIVLTISYQDGDGDLGLALSLEDNPQDFSDPYHPLNFYATDGSGGLISLTTEAIVTNEHTSRFISPVLKSTSQAHTLATTRTRDMPGFEHLPAFDVSACSYYNYPLYISGDDLNLLDGSFENIEQVSLNPPLYKITDIFYATRNTNSYNLTADLLIKQQDGSFIEYDWQSLYPTHCSFGFETRFPRIAKSKTTITSDPFIIKQSSRYNGKIEYAMKSFGIIPLFTGKTMKFRISIKDRALHTSNVIETPEFTLQSITR